MDIISKWDRQIGEVEDYGRNGELFHLAAGISFADSYIRCFYQELPSPGHGIAGINSQIYDYLFDLSGIGLYQPHLAAQLQGKLNIFADNTADHLLYLQDYIANIQNPGLNELFSYYPSTFMSQVMSLNQFFPVCIIITKVSPLPPRTPIPPHTTATILSSSFY